MKNFGLISVGAILMLIGVPSMGQQGWPPLGPGCSYIGNSPCGGSAANKCAPHQRYLSKQCGNSVSNFCGNDDYCASTSKGRVLINGHWHDRGAANRGFDIDQTGDSLTETGISGAGHGQFTGPTQFFMIWGNIRVGGVFNPQTNTISWTNGAVWVR